jgi:nicotinate-nucleotide adenylyltransferase
MFESRQAIRHYCLFGGTFDPIHLAHIEIAKAAIQAFELSEVFFVPAANPPHKDRAFMTGYEDRFRMVELACAGMDRCKPSRLEQGRDRSYTVDTLRRFRREHGDNYRLFFLIGSDAFAETETWKNWKEVLELTEFIVVSRPGISYRIPEDARVHPLETLSLEVASTRIRTRLAKGEPTPELAPGVRAYIEEKGLYGWRRQATITASP